MKQQRRDYDHDDQPQPAPLEDHEGCCRCNDVLQRVAAGPAEIGGKADQGREFRDDQEKTSNHIIETVEKGNGCDDDGEHKIEIDDRPHGGIARGGQLHRIDAVRHHDQSGNHVDDFQPALRVGRIALGSQFDDVPVKWRNRRKDKRHRLPCRAHHRPALRGRALIGRDGSQSSAGRHISFPACGRDRGTIPIRAG